MLGERVSVQSVLKRIDAEEGRPLRLTVYNARHRMNRGKEVYIQPARSNSSLPLLGLGLHFASFEDSLCSPLRVLGVFTNSPAERAGLRAGSDYILGDDRGAYRGVSDLIMGAEEHLGSSLSLFVFNKDTETIRKVNLQPRDDWGGDGCLGCDVGSGFLHRVPFSRTAKDVVAAAAAAAAAPAAATAAAAGDESDRSICLQPQQQQNYQQQQQQQQDLSAAATAAAAAAAAAAGLGMAPMDASDPAAADMLTSCLLLPTTNSPLRDPAFVGSSAADLQWGRSGNLQQQQQQQQQQQPQQQQQNTVEQLLQERSAAFADNAKSACEARSSFSFA
ncbi:gorasp2-prov protein, putative [Eimeria acervulina]|uniref:Gorasp2-prov protein, putative n=1 Tax=Eimeria acervulina TaxID=5801 RepID=U6GUA8_EIMAC|nr:gorasp2-prov protein, putative [Eimeria acervulina]CDI83851.1 gorasp2-prov protein, putative [Eimeria acervulina]